MMFLVGKEFFGKKVGFLAVSFWTFSYLANVYDRHLWALYWGPLLALIVLFCLKKIIEGSHKFIYLILGIVLVLAFFVRVYRVDKVLGFYFDQGRVNIRICFVY